MFTNKEAKPTTKPQPNIKPSNLVKYCKSLKYKEWTTLSVNLLLLLVLHTKKNTKIQLSSLTENEILANKCWDCFKGI